MNELTKVFPHWHSGYDKTGNITYIQLTYILIEHVYSYNIYIYYDYYQDDQYYINNMVNLKQL